MRSSVLAFAVVLVLGASPGAAQTIDDIGAIGPFIDGCIVRAVRLVDFPERHDVTLRLAFRRDGSLIGRPAVTYSRPPRGKPEQERFIGELMSAFAACAPLPFSKGLGGAIAGRIFTFRYTLTDQKDQDS